MKSTYNQMALPLIALRRVQPGGCHAVNDLPGGPAVRQLNLHAAVTKIAAEQAWLHWFMLIICTVIFVGVFGVMFYSIFKHRKSVGHKAGATSTRTPRSRSSGPSSRSSS